MDDLTDLRSCFDRVGIDYHVENHYGPSGSPIDGAARSIEFENIEFAFDAANRYLGFVRFGDDEQTLVRLRDGSEPATASVLNRLSTLPTGATQAATAFADVREQSEFRAVVERLLREADSDLPALGELFEAALRAADERTVAGAWSVAVALREITWLQGVFEGVLERMMANCIPDSFLARGGR